MVAEEEECVNTEVGGRTCPLKVEHDDVLPMSLSKVLSSNSLCTVYFSTSNFCSCGAGAKVYVLPKTTLSRCCGKLWGRWRHSLRMPALAGVGRGDAPWAAQPLTCPGSSGPPTAPSRS